MADPKNSELMARVRELPHKPGVYIYKDRLNRIIYVGKARDLRKRVSQYFHPSRRMKSDIKTRALIDAIWDIETHTVRSEPESILLEGKLIKQYRPRFNISYRDDKRFLMAKINLREPYPKFHLTRLRKDDGCRYFGPFASGPALRSTLTLVRKRFGLRSCKPLVPGESDYKHCLDEVIQNCSAPCVAKVSREQYFSRVQQACEFLEGKSSAMVDSIESEMKKAAEKLDFEKAARLRNLLNDIRHTTTPQRRFQREFPTAIIPEKDLEELRDLLGLIAVPAAIECFDISNISTTHKVASMVCFRDGRPSRSHYRRYRIKTVEGQDDFASIAEAVRRRYTRVLRESAMPDLIIVDGGKGQVSAAYRELELLGIPDQPLIGLAKKHEQIHLPRRPEPMIHPLESGAIRLLQRVRDEAHRTANGYHQLLLKKRIAESILDECPGVSERRKLALLRHFGSIQSIKKAGVDELSEVEGISKKLAQGIIDFFRLLKKRRQPAPRPPKDEGEGEVVYELNPD